MYIIKLYIILISKHGIYEFKTNLGKKKRRAKNNSSEDMVEIYILKAYEEK